MKESSKISVIIVLSFISALSLKNSEVAVAALATPKPFQQSLLSHNLSLKQSGLLVARGPEHCKSKYVQVATPQGGSLNVRSNNNDDAPIIGELKIGDVVELISFDQDGTWANVAVQGRFRNRESTGWVWADYLICAE